jgi:hypothetical protein
VTDLARKLHSYWVLEQELSRHVGAMFAAKARGIMRRAGINPGILGFVV